MNQPTVDIVIPSYNARHLLEKNLPKVFKHSPEINKIIVVDDGGNDDTKKFLSKKYPDKVKLVRNAENLGFSKGVNRGVAASQADYLVLLNNDVYPTSRYLKSALKYFEDQDVFAVTFNEKHSSPPKVSWKKGKLHFVQAKSKKKPRYSAWASGGSAIFRRSIWDKLGGLNEIYSPGYWEDIDLGWRAWKSGYKIIFDPQAKVIHHHESTFKKLDQKWLSMIKQRNELLFTWLNFTDFNLVISQIFFITTYTSTHPGYFKVIFKALLRLPKVESKYRKKNHYQRTDKQVFSLVNKNL